MQPMCLYMFRFKQFQETFQKTYQRKIKRMQTTTLLVKSIWFRSKFGNNPGPDRANKLEAAFVPLGPLWNVDKPHIFGHFCWFYWSVFSDTL